MAHLFEHLSPIAFELPRWRPDSAWTQHGPFALWLVEQTRPRLVVELGVFAGYSLAAFAQAAERVDLDCRVVGIDTWAGDEHGGFYSEGVYRDLAAHVGEHHARRIDLRRMTFAEALPSVADGSIDLLHVDGRHFYEDVKEDFTTWIPKLSERAVVLFHDTQVRERGFGVYRYWSELVGSYRTFEFLHGNGLGVLCHGSNAPEAAARLCDPALPAPVRDQIRMAYERLGQGVDGQRLAEKRQREAAERRARRKNPVKLAQHWLAKVSKR